MTMSDPLPPELRTSLDAALATATPVVVNEKPAMSFPGLRVVMSREVDATQATHLKAVFDGVGWPETGIPLASELTPAQRAFAEALAERYIDVRKGRMPRLPATRRRWLGLDPPTALERPYADGLPLWKYLANVEAAAEAAEEEPAEGQDVASIYARVLASLAPADRLEVLGELALGTYHLRTLENESVLGIGPEGGAWGPAYADQLLAIWGDPTSSIERPTDEKPPEIAGLLATLAIARAGVPFEPRWEPLVRLGAWTDAFVAASRDVLNAVAPARRGEIAVAATAEMFANQRVRTLLALLPAAPDTRVVEAIVAALDEEELTTPRQRIYAQLRAASAGTPVAAAVAELLDGLPQPIELVCNDLVGPTHQSQLTPVQAAQCATCAAKIMGVGSDYVNDEEIQYLELFGIFDASGARKYDAVVLMGEDGGVFLAGTNEVVAILCQYRLYCNDPALKDAIATAFESRPTRGRG
jgi:hypothetical protein